LTGPGTLEGYLALRRDEQEWVQAATLRRM
jgi:hypothetical protein